jgi:hypothetical protein
VMHVIAKQANKVNRACEEVVTQRVIIQNIKLAKRDYWLGFTLFFPRIV